MKKPTCTYAAFAAREKVPIIAVARKNNCCRSFRRISYASSNLSYDFKYARHLIGIPPSLRGKRKAIKSSSSTPWPLVSSFPQRRDPFLVPWGGCCSRASEHGDIKAPTSFLGKDRQNSNANSNSTFTSNANPHGQLWALTG